ncbi:MAG: 50S ribosomal protein L17 [candidate division Zixibacteria bacterium]|nr:50S ribosomal protein L17 [candidate division Zixibacteria bacterium]
MRHQVKTKKLNRPTPHREAMLANLATSVLEHRTIHTTEARAKEVRRVVDRLITIAKQDTLAARRQVGKTIRNKDVVKKLFSEIIPQFQDRPSGYTRVLRTGFRRGDSAMMSMVELLTAKPKIEKEKDKKKEKAAKKK